MLTLSQAIQKGEVRIRAYDLRRAPHSVSEVLIEGGEVIIEKRVRVNEQIRISQVRVIGNEGQQLGVMNPQEGLRLARETSLDLVEVAPLAKPPVCRIMDYSKYKYDQERKEREARKRQHLTRLKEVRYKPNIDEHDYQTKLEHIREFIKRHSKVKISMMFRGRELAHTEKGRQVLQRIIQDLTDMAEVEKAPSREGRYLNMVLIPK